MTLDSHRHLAELAAIALHNSRTLEALEKAKTAFARWWNGERPIISVDDGGKVVSGIRLQK